MHRANNFDPEWGYVAGANSFARTVGIVLVATAIGATAGAGVVVSLVDLPTGQVSVAAHTSAAFVQAAVSEPAPAQPNPQPVVKSEMPLQVSQQAEAAANELSSGPKNPEPVDIASLAEVSPNGAPVNAATAPSAGAAPVENKAPKQQYVARRYAPQFANRTWAGPWR